MNQSKPLTAKQQAFGFFSMSNAKNTPNEPPAQSSVVADFSFNRCDKYLRSSGVPYFCLFRNNGMNLEALKATRSNMLPFVMPITDYIKSNNIKKIACAPKGGRCEKSGFHFATGLLEMASEIVNFELIHPFVNEKNHISMPHQLESIGGMVIFDDIVTRGTTLRKMVDLSGISRCFILIGNH